LVEEKRAGGRKRCPDAASLVEAAVSLAIVRPRRPMVKKRVADPDPRYRRDRAPVGTRPDQPA
jgi:hypothetical protein